MGRTTEWAFLKGTYDRAADHRGTLISVVGAPGVGKSRLVHDFIRLTVGGDSGSVGGSLRVAAHDIQLRRDQHARPSLVQDRVR